MHNECRIMRSSRLLPIYATLAIFECALILSLVTAQPGRAAETVWVEMWRHEATSPIADAATATLRGSEAPILATLNDNRVTLYTLLDEGPKFISVIDELPHIPTSVTLETLGIGSLVDVWVGTASPGVVHIFRVDVESGTWEQRHRIGLVWDHVEEVLPFNMDEDGELDVAIRTRSGRLSVYRWTREGYREVNLGSVGRGVQAIAVGHIVGDGKEELVISRGRDQVLIFRWESPIPSSDVSSVPAAQSNTDIDEAPADEGSLVQVWENYLWGGHIGLFVGPFSSDPWDQIAVLTAQNLVYLYEWNSEVGRMSATSAPLQWPEPYAQLLGVGRLSRETGGYQVIQGYDEGIASWRILPTVRKLQSLSTSLRPVVQAAFPPVGSAGVIVSETGFALLRPRPVGYVRVVYRGREIQLKHPPLTRADTIYISADDWRHLAGVTLRWDAESGRVSGVRGFRFIVGDTRGGDWFIDGRVVDFDPAAIEHDGRLYLPIQFGQLLGARALWEPYSYTLVVD